MTERRRCTFCTFIQVSDLSERALSSPRDRRNCMLAGKILGGSVALVAAILNASAHAQQTQVVLLGTGTPPADPDRSGAATAIVVNGTPYLVDFGAGVVRRAKSAVVDRGVAGLDPVKLRVVFVTHLHSDHTVGYPDLILTPWVLGRRVPLEVYGPV